MQQIAQLSSENVEGVKNKNKLKDKNTEEKQLVL